jgi:hypothetical protein
MSKVCIDEPGVRAHAIQIHRDSDSILTTCQVADPYIRDVMQFITTTRVDVHGGPNHPVIENILRLSGGQLRQ